MSEKFSSETKNPKQNEALISIERHSFKYVGQRRNVLFPVTFNYSGPLDCIRLTLVSEIKNTNISSSEMLAHQQFSQ